jgi:hypothetical protein
VTVVPPTGQSTTVPAVSALWTSLGDAALRALVADLRRGLRRLLPGHLLLQRPRSRWHDHDRRGEGQRVLASAEPKVSRLRNATAELPTLTPSSPAR